MKKRIEVSSALMRIICASVLLWSGVTCADSWQDTTAYVDRLGSTAPNGVCIAIAQVRPEGAKKHVAGECDSSSLSGRLPRPLPVFCWLMQF